MNTSLSNYYDPADVLELSTKALFDAHPTELALCFPEKSVNASPKITHLARTRTTHRLNSRCVNLIVQINKVLSSDVSFEF